MFWGNLLISVDESVKLWLEFVVSVHEIMILSFLSERVCVCVFDFCLLKMCQPDYDKDISIVTNILTL